MIASALRLEIEQYANRVRHSNPLFVKAMDGTLTPSTVATYLENIRQLICNNQRCLRIAGKRARAMGDDALAAHFSHKHVEEEGHDQWAERDVKHLSNGTAAPRSTANAAAEIVTFLDRVIEEDPTLFLSYMLFAEYLTVLMGPEWLKALEERCGIPGTATTVISNHVELDKDHVEEALDCIDDLVGDPRKLPRMREVLREMCAHYDHLCSEVTGVANHDASGRNRVVAA